ncbi:hypothetical protein [Lutibacter citreus]|uniref:hypothetical protein n=1 Tax=Lutibacter citreus TaxID=2138210 RepID=UPI000DBE03A1|nr:hypothetical protein [Lutibacter citreus]
MNLLEKYSGNYKLFFLTVIMLFFFSIIQAQTRDTFFLWTDKVPGEKEKKRAPVQIDNTKGNVVRLTNITNPALVVYEPIKQNNSDVGIIIFPSGGYNILAIDLEGYEIAEWLNKLGYTAFVKH